MKVRTLQWDKFHDGLYTAKAAPLGTYAITDGYITLKLNGSKISQHESLPDAQRAGQKHFEKAILSAMVTFRCVWCGCDSERPTFGCSAPDGNGHMYELTKVV